MIENDRNGWVGLEICRLDGENHEGWTMFMAECPVQVRPCKAPELGSQVSTRSVVNHGKPLPACELVLLYRAVGAVAYSHGWELHGWRMSIAD
jgi:hypothetical protein